MTGPRGYARQDDYAAHRCGNCGHLRYANQKPGDPCIAPRCSCTDHKIPAEREVAAS